MAGRQELEVVDGSTTYEFAIAPPIDASGKLGTGKSWSLQTKAWEPTDPVLPWRYNVHPWAAGIAQSKVNPHITLSGELRNRPALVYGKANADLSFQFKMVPPPALNFLGATISTSYPLAAAPLAYGGGFYGQSPYMGASPATSAITTVARNFYGTTNSYFGGGQYLYKLDSSYNFTLLKDFGAGNTIYDMEPFNGELIIAMGSNVKMWKMSTTEVFTQATDATYAIALGTVGSFLWRATNPNLLTNCITAPLTLASWAPGAGSEYTVGDTTCTITDIKEYGGVPWIMKPNGVFAPDSTTTFYNQAPQLDLYPHADNGKGCFVAWGYIWAPSVVGLLRMSTGESVTMGPEQSNRRNYRFWTRAGIEFNGSIYLLCTDEGGTEQSFICKMTKDLRGLSENPSTYIYHELARLGGVAKGYVIAITVSPTNPTLVVGYDKGITYALMGRGGGADIDDANYTFGSAYELESGDMVVAQDLGVEVGITGAKIVGTQPAGCTVKLQYDIDNTGTYTDMLDTVEGGGVALITTTGPYAAIRYAPIGTKGHVVQIKIVGTTPGNLKGTNRPEVRDVWAFGEYHPQTTDFITIDIYADRAARVRGLQQGIDAEEIVALYRSWQYRGSILDVRIPNYEVEHTTRFAVSDVKEKSLEVIASGNEQRETSICTVIFKRIDNANIYGVS